MAGSDCDAGQLLSRSSFSSPFDSSDEISVEKPRRRLSLWTRFMRAACHPRQSVPNFASYPFGLKIHGKPSSKIVRSSILLLNFTSIILFVLLLISIIDAILYPSYAHPPEHYELLQKTVELSSRPGRGNARRDKIFIASNIINADLIRGRWGQSMQELIEYLGPENVFMSVYENDSGPETAAALHEFARKLECDHSVTSGAHLPLSDFPSIITPTGQARVKRLTYLTEVRNRLLWPLDEPSSHSDPAGQAMNYTNTRFDRILFINDVYFNVIDALQLLFSTHYNVHTDKAEYQAACATDFTDFGQFYDTFVVRDTEGHGTGFQFFPWFAPTYRPVSRNAVLAESDAVPVKSCWGGMVAYDATEFLRADVLAGSPKANGDTELSENEDTWKALQHQQGPLRFRHQSEIYWEESECCLINADLAQRMGPENAKIYLNPYVRVAYKKWIWRLLPTLTHFERVFGFYQYMISKIWFPEFNPRRIEIPGRDSVQLKWVYDDESLNGEAMRDLNVKIDQKKLGGSWKMVRETARPGGFCGQRRLFLMKKDLEKANKGSSGKNWEKGPFPKVR